MSVEPVTHFVAVCDSCARVGVAPAPSEAEALDAACRSTWTNTSFGLLCAECQPCTECTHNSGPVADGRLCETCQAVVCDRCGHQRREHMHFPNARLYGCPTRVCYLPDGSYAQCGCPFEAGLPTKASSNV